jgi:hypothetical protein
MKTLSTTKHYTLSVIGVQCFYESYKQSLDVVMQQQTIACS